MMATSERSGRVAWELVLGLIALALAGLILAAGLWWLKAGPRSGVESAKSGAESEMAAGKVPQADSPQAAASGPGNYDEDPGPWKVGTQMFMLEDKARNKQLPLKVYYPEQPRSGSTSKAGDKSPFPVIIFSHGAGGNREVAPELLSFWASHGYVVFAATHQDSLSLAKARGEETSMKEILTKFGTDPQFRISRVEDDRLIIDSLTTLPRLVPELEGKLDATRIGVGGHSAGAMTAVLMGGAIMDMPVNGVGGPEVEGLKEARVAATLLLSGQGITRGPGDRQMGAIKENTWEDCDGPMMVMTGSLDDSAETGQTAASRKDPYIYAPPGDKYLLFIEGAAHMSFTGRAAGREGRGSGKLQNLLLGRGELQKEIEKYDQDAIFTLIESNSLAYWDAYLKADAGAKAFLQSDAPGAAAEGMLEYEYK